MMCSPTRVAISIWLVRLGLGTLGAVVLLPVAAARMSPAAPPFWQAPAAGQAASGINPVAPGATPTAVMARVRELERAGDFGHAADVLRDALRVDPHAVDLRFALAYALLRGDRPREALGEYTTASADRRPTAEELGHVGQAYILLGDTADADHWTSLAVREKPRDPDLWYSLGRIRYTEQRFAEAAACFRHALALSPRNAKAENNLGLAEEGLNQEDAAIAAYRQSIAWFDAEDAAMAAAPGRGTGANEAGGGGTGGGGTSGSGTGEGNLRPGGSAEAAEAVPRGSDQPRLNLAIILIHRGEPGEARELLRRAVASSPGDAHIHEQLGQLALQQGDAAGAVVAFREAVRLAPGDRGFHFLLGQALRRAGQPGEAQHEFAEAARLATQAAATPRLP